MFLLFIYLFNQKPPYREVYGITETLQPLGVGH